MEVIYMIKPGKSASAGRGVRAYRQTQIYASLCADAFPLLEAQLKEKARVCLCVTEHVSIAVLTTSLQHSPQTLSTNPNVAL